MRSKRQFKLGCGLGCPVTLVACLSLAFAAFGQPKLAGVIDLHAHCDPDSVPRAIDALDLAKLAHQDGMRGLVLKNCAKRASARLSWM